MGRELRPSWSCLSRRPRASNLSKPFLLNDAVSFFFFPLTFSSFWNFLSRRHLFQSYISERIYCQEEKKNQEWGGLGSLVTLFSVPTSSAWLRAMCPREPLVGPSRVRKRKTKQHGPDSSGPESPCLRTDLMGLARLPCGGMRCHPWFRFFPVHSRLSWARLWDLSYVHGSSPCFLIVWALLRRPDLYRSPHPLKNIRSPCLFFHKHLQASSRPLLKLHSLLLCVCAEVTRCTRGPRRQPSWRLPKGPCEVTQGEVAESA